MKGRKFKKYLMSTFELKKLWTTCTLCLGASVLLLKITHIHN